MINHALGLNRKGARYVANKDDSGRVTWIVKKTKWETIHWKEAHKLPSKPGCYVAILITPDGNRAIYVGESTNMRARVHGGHSPRKLRLSDGKKVETPWGIFWSDCLYFKFRVSEKYGDWLMREARLINRLSPPGNSRGVQRDPSERIRLLRARHVLAA